MPYKFNPFTGTLDDSTPGSVGSLNDGSAGTPSIRFLNSASTGIYSPGANQLGVATNGTSRLSIDASGNVAVDTNTLYVDAANNRVGIGITSPGSALHVVGTDIRFSNSVNTSFIGSISHDASTTGNNFYNCQDTGGHVFQRQGTEQMRLDASSRLLVGTSTARSNFYGAYTARAQIEGVDFETAALNITCNNATDINSGVISLNKSGGATVGSNTIVSSGERLGSIRFQGNDGTNFIDAAYVLAEVDGTPGANDMPGRLVFSTTADGASSPTERMRITSEGKVLVGRTSVVLSSKFLSQYAGNVDNGIVINETANTASTTFLAFGLSGTAIGSVGRVGATSAVIYNTTSDYRLKTIVGSVTGQGERIDALKPIDYLWKEGGEHARGFLAHEFQEVYANSVTGEKDAVDADGNPIYQAMQASTPEIIADLVAEIQSLRARVAALEAN